MKYQKLLQIDDDQDDCELFAEALREVSEITYTAINNPIKALQKLKSGKIKPDLIILDFNMPGMNGLDLLEALKRDSDASKIPVIMLSTSSREDFRKTAIERGALDYITKPTSFDALKRVVKSLFQK